MNEDLKLLLTGICLDFSKIDERFVKNVHLTYNCGKIKDISLLSFRKMIEDNNEPSFDNVDIDLDFVLLETVIAKTVAHLNRDT